jgi:hypothetical protein
MSTRDRQKIFLGSRAPLIREADSLTAIYEPIVWTVILCVIHRRQNPLDPSVGETIDGVWIANYTYRTLIERRCK